MLAIYDINIKLIFLLIVLIIADFATGIIKSLLQKRFRSSLCREGIIKKAGTLFIIAIGILLHVSLQLVGVKLSFEFEILNQPVVLNMPNSLSLFYIFYEAASNIENFKAFGVPVPEILKNLFNRKDK